MAEAVGVTKLRKTTIKIGSLVNDTGLTGFWCHVSGDTRCYPDDPTTQNAHAEPESEGVGPTQSDRASSDTAQSDGGVCDDPTCPSYAKHWPESIGS